MGKDQLLKIKERLKSIDRLLYELSGDEKYINKDYAHLDTAIKDREPTLRLVKVNKEESLKG